MGDSENKNSEIAPVAYFPKIIGYNMDTDRRMMENVHLKLRVFYEEGIKILETQREKMIGNMIRNEKTHIKNPKDLPTDDKHLDYCLVHDGFISVGKLYDKNVQIRKYASLENLADQIEYELDEKDCWLLFENKDLEEMMIDHLENKGIEYFSHHAPSISTGYPDLH